MESRKERAMDPKETIEAGKERAKETKVERIAKVLGTTAMDGTKGKELGIRIVKTKMPTVINLENLSQRERINLGRTRMRCVASRPHGEGVQRAFC